MGAIKARIAAFEAEMALLEIKGGPGSGNWGHGGGRGGKGKPGGSRPRSEVMSRTSGRDWQARQAAAKAGKGGGGVEAARKDVEAAKAKLREVDDRLKELNDNGTITQAVLDLYIAKDPAKLTPAMNKLRDQAVGIDKARKERAELEAKLADAEKRFKEAGGKTKAQEIGSGGPPKDDGGADGLDKAIGFMADGVTADEYAPYYADGETDARLKKIVSADNRSRVDAKMEIMNKLAERSGLSPQKTDEMVKSWAGTSADNNVEALKMQVAAARFLGIEPDPYVKERLGALEKTAHGQPDRHTDRERDAFIKAMYEHTQEQLAAAGFKPDDTIRVYRGVRDVFKGTGVQHGDEIQLEQNALTSWSLSSSVGESFASGTLKANGSGLLTMDVPVSSIVGTCKTGFGCLVEAEVVIGDNGNHRALVEDKYVRRGK